jgi:filamentous hemagglutinin family protein
MHIRHTLPACKNEPRHHRPRRTRAQSPAALTFAASLSFGALSPALAGPTGGVVVEGQGSISTPAAGQTRIDQTSSQLHLNWNTFDVAANESVQFNQPSASSIAFNRILDQNPSQIFGTIQANGQVVLVNPNGLLIGRSAQLNVGSLVASSLDAIDFDATTGRYRFSASRDLPGAVRNAGTITAGAGGSVTLLGGQVSNTGSIIADYGSVNLAAGRTATLDLAGDGLLRLEVGSDLAGSADGSADAVLNSGTVQANGGRVLLTAAAVQDVFTNLVNNTGIVQASRIDNSGGVIRLVGAGGTVQSSGTLDASAGDSVSTGGSVAVLGERVGLFDNAVVDVSGATGGGQALIGGDFQGSNPDVLNASRTYVGANAHISADAGATGDGGRVIVWADDVTRFDGNISAQGGTLSGNGGFAEVSGKHSLRFTGFSDLRADHGTKGTLLLDPDAILIDSSATAPANADDFTWAFNEDTGPEATIGAARISTLLGSSSVTLQATDTIRQDLGADISGTHGLTLEAGGNITLNGDISLTGGALTVTSTGPGGNIKLGGTYTADSATVTASDGSIEVSTVTAAGDVSLTAATGPIFTSGTASITATNLTLSSSSGIGTLANPIGTTASTLTATAGAGAYIVETDALTINNLTSGPAGDVEVTAGGALTASNISVTGGDLSLTSLAGGIAVGTVAASNATLTAQGGGSITEAGSSSITASGLTLSAGGAIGAPGNEIGTNVNSLSATASNGDVRIQEVNSIDLTNVSASSGKTVAVSNSLGNITASDVSAASGTVQLTSAGGIGVGTINSSTVTLTANNGSITEAGGGALTATTATLNASGGIGSSGNAIGTTLTSLNAAATGGGVYIAETNGLTLSNVSASSGNAVEVTSSSGNITATNVNATSGSVKLTASSGNVGVGALSATSVTVDAGGSITESVASSITASNASLTAAASIGTLANDINTTVGSLTANAASGNVYITEADGLTLANVSAGSNVGVTSTTGSITAANVSAGGALDLRATAGGIGVGALTGADVTLTAGNGAITESGTSSVSAANATFFASTNIGAAGNAINTTVNSLVATASNGGVYIDETNGLTLTNVLASPGNDIVVTNGIGAITATSVVGTGNTTLTSGGGVAVGTVNGNNVTITANGGSITESGTSSISGTNATLTASGGIGSATNDINTTVGSLTAQAANGNVYVSESDGLTLTNVSAAGGTNGVTISAGGPIAVGTVSAPGSVTLATTSGALQDDGLATQISANALTLTAPGGIGAAGAEIDTNVASLTATASAGGVYVAEANGLTLTSVTAGGGDAVVSSATGNIVAGAVSATGAVTFAAASGGIDDDTSDATTISAPGGISLSAASNIGTVTDFATLAGKSVDVQTSGALSAAVADNNGQINLNLSGTPSLAAGAIRLGSGTNRAGTVVVQSSGNLDASGFSPGAIDIGGSNTTSVALSSGGTLMLPAGGGFTDQPADTLLVRGVTDIVDNDGTPREFQVAAKSLTFQSGGAGGPTALHTTVANLDATNGADLTITETDDVTLGTISSTGNVTITAGGAVADDGLDATRVSGNAVAITGTLIGGSSELETSANSLSATASAGGIRVRESDAVTLTASATGGPVDVQTDNGALTVTSAAGTGVTLASGGAGNALVLNGAVEGGTGDVSLTAGMPGNRGDIVLAAAHHVGGNALTVVGNSIGTTAQRLNTTVSSVDATSGPGAIFISESDSLSSLTATTSNGVYVQTAGALTAGAVTGGLIQLETTGNGSALTVGGALNAGAGQVVLSTSGAGSDISINAPVSAGYVSTSATGAGSNINLAGVITAANDVTLAAGSPASRGAIATAAGNQVVAHRLSAVGSSVGTSSFALNTNVDLIDATGTNGGVRIAESNDVSLFALATGGNLDVTSGGAITVTGALGNSIQFTSSDDITVSGTVAAVAGGVGISSLGDVVLDGPVNTADGLNLSSLGTVTLNNTVSGANIDITAGAPGSQKAILTGTGNHLGGTSLTLRGASIGSSASRLNTTADAIDALTGPNGGIFITETNSLALNAVAGPGGTLSVQTLNGGLTVASAVGDGVLLETGGDNAGITLNGGTSGGLQGRAGDVVVRTHGADSEVVLNDAVSTSGQLTIETGANSNIVLNSVIGNPSSVTLTAGTAASRGDVVAGAPTSDLTGNSIAITAGRIGSSGARLNTSTGTLNTTSTAGGTYITNAGATTLASSVSGGALDAATTNGSLTVTSASGNSIALAAGGDGSNIALNSSLSTPGDVSLTAGSSTKRGAITTAPGVQITANKLTAIASSIGTSGSRLGTTVTSLDATSTDGGIYVIEADALTLTAKATGGAVDVQTTNGALSVAGASGTGVTLAAGGAGNGITVNGAVNAGTGDVALTAGTSTSRGAITAGTGNLVSGGALTAAGSTIGAGGASLNTSITTLTATASNGGVYINEQNGLTLASVTAAGSAGDINVASASGDVTVGVVTASRDAAISASAGAIVDDGDDTTRLASTGLTLLGRSVGAPSTLSGATLDGSLRLDTSASTLHATSTAGGIYINELDGLQSVNLNAGGGTAGDIELLTATGDLNLQSVLASDSLLLAAGHNIFALPGSSPITARVAELRAGGADATAGRLGTQTQLLGFNLSAGDSLRLFVPQSIDPKDATRAPATLPSPGVTTTLSLFGAPDARATLAGFGQFQSVSDTPFTSAAEGLVRTVQNQTNTVQSVLGLDWGSFEANVSLFGTLEPAVCLPSDQRDEEEGGSGC